MFTQINNYIKDISTFSPERKHHDGKDSNFYDLKKNLAMSPKRDLTTKRINRLTVSRKAIWTWVLLISVLKTEDEWSSEASVSAYTLYCVMNEKIFRNIVLESEVLRKGYCNDLVWCKMSPQYFSLPLAKITCATFRSVALSPSSSRKKDYSRSPVSILECCIVRSKFIVPMILKYLVITEFE
jgi:hypothetical protein